MPQLDISLYIPQLFWLCIFFVLLFLGIYFVIEPRFQKIFQKRSLEIDEKLKEIEFLKKETDRLKDQAQLAEDQFQERLKKIIQETMAKTNTEIQALKENHHKKLLQELALFDEAIAKNQDKTLKLLQEKEAEFVDQIFAKLLSSKKKG
ncbi:MAG: hypothetical protein WCG05_01570 [Alphaproteobacteria bacterium]